MGILDIINKIFPCGGKKCPECKGDMRLYKKAEDIREVGQPGDVYECIDCGLKFKSVSI